MAFCTFELDCLWCVDVFVHWRTYHVTRIRTGPHDGNEANHEGHLQHSVVAWVGTIFDCGNHIVNKGKNEITANTVVGWGEHNMEASQETHQRKQQGRIIETRIMVNGEIITVSDWFPAYLNESTAIQQLRRRYSPQPHLSLADAYNDNDLERITQQVERNGIIGTEEI